MLNRLGGKLARGVLGASWAAPRTIEDALGRRVLLALPAKRTLLGFGLPVDEARRRLRGFAQRNGGNARPIQPQGSFMPNGK